MGMDSRRLSPSLRESRDVERASSESRSAFSPSRSTYLEFWREFDATRGEFPPVVGRFLCFSGVTLPGEITVGCGSVVVAVWGVGWTASFPRHPHVPVAGPCLTYPPCFGETSPYPCLEKEGTQGWWSLPV